jgi:hypothetical protein
VMRYGAVVVVGVDVVPVQETYKGFEVVLPGAEMNVTTLVVVAAIVPVPDTVTGLLSLAWAGTATIAIAVHPTSSNAMGIAAAR